MDNFDNNFTNNLVDLDKSDLLDNFEAQQLVINAVDNYLDMIEEFDLCLDQNVLFSQDMPFVRIFNLDIHLVRFNTTDFADYIDLDFKVLSNFHS